jgi:hypothetical protein
MDQPVWIGWESSTRTTILTSIQNAFSVFVASIPGKPLRTDISKVNRFPYLIKMGMFIFPEVDATHV